MLAALLLALQLDASNQPVQAPRPRADPYQSCGRAFHRQLEALPKKTRDYDASFTQATARADLDHDGTLDDITVESEPNLTPCNMVGWEKHTNRISIRFDADHRFDYEWQGDRIRGMRIYPAKQQIQVYGDRATGDGWQQTIHYDLPEGR